MRAPPIRQTVVICSAHSLTQRRVGRHGRPQVGHSHEVGGGPVKEDCLEMVPELPRTRKSQAELTRKCRRGRVHSRQSSKHQGKELALRPKEKQGHCVSANSVFQWDGGSRLRVKTRQQEAGAAFQERRQGLDCSNGLGHVGREKEGVGRVTLGLCFPEVGHPRSWVALRGGTCQSDPSYPGDGQQRTGHTHPG